MPRKRPWSSSGTIRSGDKSVLATNRSFDVLEGPVERRRRRGQVALWFLSSATKVFFGCYPAWRASRLDPIAALRAD